jgi:hypothetical protein
LFDEKAWPTTWNGKIVRQIMPFKMCKPHYNRWEASQLLKVVVNPSLEVLALGYG